MESSEQPEKPSEPSEAPPPAPEPPPPEPPPQPPATEEKQKPEPPPNVTAAILRARAAIGQEAAPSVPRVEAPPPSRMVMANVTRGPIQKPIRALMYGVDGIGKTTFAATSDSPVFIGLEDGTSTLDLTRYPQPRTWSEVLEALNDLALAAHSFKTVVLDTLDWLEPLCWQHVVNIAARRGGRTLESIEDIPYGRGYTAALDEWRVLLNKLDRLRTERGMQVILIAHAWIKPFRNPEGEDFDRFEIKLHPKAAAMVREWVDCVLFATHEQYAHTKNGRTRGVTTGARIMHTQRKAAFDAKNRYGLSETLPLDWEALMAEVRQGAQNDPRALMVRIAASLEGAPDELRARVRAAVQASRDDAAKLMRIASRLTVEMNTYHQRQNAAAEAAAAQQHA